jgi:hypothetical protein
MAVNPMRKTAVLCVAASELVCSFRFRPEFHPGVPRAAPAPPCSSFDREAHDLGIGDDFGQRIDVCGPERTDQQAGRFDRSIQETQPRSVGGLSPGPGNGAFAPPPASPSISASMSS